VPIVFPFCCVAGGGSVKSVIGAIVSAALVPIPTPGTPVIDQISSWSSTVGGSVPKAESIHRVEVDDRLFAGMIGKSVLSSPGGKRSISMVVSPANSWFLFQTRNSFPKNGPVLQLGLHENELPPVTTLSSLNPSDG
jgi:hypothetical protein